MADRVSGDDDGSVSSDMPGAHLHPPSPYLPLIPADRRIGAGWVQLLARSVQWST